MHGAIIGRVADLHSTWNPLWVRHHNRAIGPGPLCLAFSPAAGLDGDQLAGPEVDYRDIFQPIALGRTASVIVHKPDAAQRVMQKLPVQEFRLATPIHLQHQTQLRIVRIRRDILAGSYEHYSPTLQFRAYRTIT